MDFTTPGDHRVFLVFYNMGLGGVQTKMLDLANTLVSQGAECWVLLDEKGEHDRICQFDPRVRVVICWDHPRLAKWPFRRLRGLRFIIFVIVMTLGFRPSCLFLSLCTLAVPIVSFFRRFNPSMLRKIIINEDTFPSLELSYNHPLWGRSKISDLYPHVKGVIAVSKSTYEDLKKSFHIPSPPLIYLPNWVLFQSDKRTFLGKRSIDIVFGGRLDPQKRPMIILELVEWLFSQCSDLVVRLYGDGKLADAVDKKIVALRLKYNIRYNRPIESFGHVLRDSKIIVFTSLYEGLPFVGLEAMACGTVITGLDVPGVRDIIDDNRTGMLARNLGELRYNVISLLSDSRKRNRLAANALLRVKKDFSMKNRDKLIKLILK